MAGKDYYDTLGVTRDSSKEEIRKAYKKLAKKYHPDLNKDDSSAEKKFKEINEAAAILSDDTKRQQFDQYGSESFKQGGGSSANYSNFDFSSFGGNFDDIFDHLGDIFGGSFGGRSSQKRSQRRGHDLQAEIEITLDEVAKGTKKVLQIRKNEKCSDCEGKGGTGLESCSNCHGSGSIRDARRTPFGIFQTTSPCRTCAGSGEVIRNVCGGCKGNGMVKSEKKLEVDIPEGIENGSRLRLSDEGEAGYRGGPSGDLYVIVHVKPHEIFERHDEDIYLEVPISIVEASLGDKIEVPTLDGKASLKIPAGTQSETIFKMKGKGLPYLHSYGEGDQLVKVIVQTPEKLSKKQKKLVEELGKELGDKVEPSKSFFKKFF